MLPWQHPLQLATMTFPGMEDEAIGPQPFHDSTLFALTAVLEAPATHATILSELQSCALSSKKSNIIQHQPTSMARVGETRRRLSKLFKKNMDIRGADDRQN
jgi:hypothetical protein